MADIFLDKRTQGQKGIWKWFGRNKFYVLLSTNNKNMSVVNCFFRQKNTRTKGRYWNRGFDRNKSYVLLFFCLQIIKTCPSRTIFFGQKDIRTKGDMEMECLVEINLMFFCSYVLKQWKFVCCELFF